MFGPYLPGEIVSVGGGKGAMCSGLVHWLVLHGDMGNIGNCVCRYVLAHVSVVCVHVCVVCARVCVCACVATDSVQLFQWQMAHP